MLSRLLNLVRHRKLDRDFETEIRHHLDSLEAEYRAKGLSFEEARAAARKDFGGIVKAQEEYRDQSGLPALENILRDIRFAVRSLIATRAFTAAVIATLAIGIGATTVIFSVVNGVLLKPLPYPDPEQLVSLAHVMPGLGNGEAGMADFLHLTYAAQSETLQASGMWNSRAATITGRGEPEQVPSVFVTSDLLPLLRVFPVRGRLFAAGDSQPGNPLTTVLTYEYWQRQFGGVDSIVGEMLTIDDRPHEIIGVMPRGFRFLDVQTELFRPVQIDRSQIVQGNFSFLGMARLKPGVSLDQASADMARMIPIAIDSFPAPAGITKEEIHRRGLAPNLSSLKDAVVGDVGDTLWVLMGTIGMVLLIACANVANLFLVRTEGRQRELAVRSALGAGRLRIVSALLTEALLLGVAGGLLGCAAAYAGLRFLLQNAPANLPRVSEIGMDATVLAFAALLTIGTALIFGLAPALRYAAARPNVVLHAGGRSMSLSRDRRRVRSLLVIAQVALALVLLIACGLMAWTYRSLVNVDPGFQNPETVQLANIVFPRGQAFDAERSAQALRQMVEEVRAIPGVTGAAYSSSAPLEGGGATSTLWIEGFSPEGELPAARRLKFVSPQYFQTLGVPLLAGRDLEWVDHFDARNVAIISAGMAKEVWGSSRAALGKRVRSNPSDPWREIVGIAGDVHEDGVNQPVVSTVYFPYIMKSFWNNPTLFWGIGTLILRTERAGTDVLVREMQRAVWSVNGSIPLATPRTMGEPWRSMARTSFTLVLLSAAGLMALLLGIVGIYAVIAYSVTQRRREIGIRIALGASPHGVRMMFTKQALILVAIGTAIGLVAAFGLTRLMESLLYGVSPLDPVTFLLMPGLLALIAVLASYLPSLRALRVDPMVVLREE